MIASPAARAIHGRALEERVAFALGGSRSEKLLDGVLRRMSPPLSIGFSAEGGCWAPQAGHRPPPVDMTVPHCQQLKARLCIGSG
jgi:hypothetical protein